MVYLITGDGVSCIECYDLPLPSKDPVFNESRARASDEDCFFASLVVPKSLIAGVRKVLVEWGQTIPRAKYEACSLPLRTNQEPSKYSTSSDGPYFKIPTRIPVSLPSEKRRSLQDCIVGPHGLEKFHGSIYMVYDTLGTPKLRTTAKSSNKLQNVISKWLDSLPSDIRSHDTDCLRSVIYKYHLFETLFLLPAEVRDCIFKIMDHPHVQTLYEAISRAFSKPRIALNARIPVTYDSILRQHKTSTIGEQASLDAIRKRLPVDFTPLYGDFGELVIGEPKERDLAEAYWERISQNGIWQVWAPRYTMFSHKNLSEKKRVLDFAWSTDQSAYAAVDLYAGIGYFAFSYVKAGADKVLCWEINPWSVEGMRRGAGANAWKCKIVSESEDFNHEDLQDVNPTKLIAFSESNEKAAERIAPLRSLLAPIRHVNCGLLPSSKASWRTAISVLDPIQGGWIHVHENTSSLHLCKEEAVAEFKQLCNQMKKPGQIGTTNPTVSCVHVEKVKEYAPRIFHCVFDIFIDPQPPDIGSNDLKLEKIV